MRTLFVFAIAIVGCTSNHFRSPAFVGTTAPTPTAVTGVLKCLAEKHDGADAVATALDAELRKGGDVATIDPQSRLTICDEIASDETLSTLAVDWETGGTVIGPIAQTIARRYVVKSIVIPLVRSVNRCTAPAKGSKTPMSTECKESRVDVAFLLYGADGIALWRSVDRFSVPSKGFDSIKLANDMKGALASVPAVRLAKLPLPQTD